MRDLLYVFDAYCGWCYGMAPALRELAADDDIRITVIHGALFSGVNSAPIGHFGHIPGANARIAELTGVAFGPDYERLLSEGRMLLDSDAAARGLAALRASAGDHRVLEMAGAMQTAFYRDGRSLSDAETYATIAADRGFDAGTVRRQLDDDVIAARARRDQEWLAELGVHSYPMLLLRRGDELVQIGSPTSTAAQLRAQIAAAARVVTAPREATEALACSPDGCAD